MDPKRADHAQKIPPLQNLFQDVDLNARIAGGINTTYNESWNHEKLKLTSKDQDFLKTYSSRIKTVVAINNMGRNWIKKKIETS